MADQDMEKENRSLESESRRREEEERLSYIMRHAGGIKTVINPFLRRRGRLADELRHLPSLLSHVIGSGEAYGCC
jgi:hypothetical protein